MERKNNARCNRKACAYNKGYYSRLVDIKYKDLPKQCPRCKQYDTIEKL